MLGGADRWNPGRGPLGGHARRVFVVREYGGDASMSDSTDFITPLRLRLDASADALDTATLRAVHRCLLSLAEAAHHRTMMVYDHRFGASSAVEQSERQYKIALYDAEKILDDVGL